MQAASQKAPASTRNARGRLVAGVSSHLRKSFSAIRAPCKRQAVERHPRDGPSPSSRATGRKPPAPIAAPGGTAPTRNRDAATVSPRFAREHSRETVGVGAGVRREYFRETEAVDAGIRKDPSALRKGPSSWDAHLASLAFLRAAAPAQSPVGRPRSFKPPRPGPLRGRAAWRCDRSTAGSQAPPRRPGRSPARRSTAPPGGSTRGSRA